MAEIEIRPAISNDIAILEGIDHSCETTHVWQLNTIINKDQINVDLREIRLPRVLRLAYPRRAESLKDTWTQHTLFLVARCEDNLVGYLILDENVDQESAVIRDVVVTQLMRRQGIATTLIYAAQDWLKKRGMTRLILEIPAKNHPMISLTRKLRFEFAGMADHYYANHDMVFFFLSQLK
ncbi:MAG TPA: GNAT family N-acetyltransferase [Anaerolineaceae bacterium]|nr:GNAT family N-acetyltransferase [Anaerolineaceae bacterium]